jgi:ribosomal protein S18 acetylase RimI-like enzyme
MIRPASTSSDLAQARQLFLEYATEWNLDLSFQNFAAELEGLPEPYAPPTGRLLLSDCDGQLAGCVALRKFSEGVAEMKRLYVRPAFRGRKIGRALTEAILREAVQAGYGRMRLDTLARMGAAIALYTSLGFRPIAAYRHNPLADAVFLEVELGSRITDGSSTRS